jgi:hypothetical protein
MEHKRIVRKGVRGNPGKEKVTEFGRERIASTRHC